MSCIFPFGSSKATLREMKAFVGKEKRTALRQREELCFVNKD